MSAFTRQHGAYEISDDPARIDVDAVERLLRGTYWAATRPRAVIERSIARSLNFGVYHAEAQVGFGRVITDGETFAWICDVVIDEAHRGGGLGKAFVEAIVTHPEIAEIRQLLATRDAHTLYEKFDFQRYGDLFLGRRFRVGWPEAQA